MTPKEFKQSIIEHMDFGIKHTDLQDAYSIGFRNGIRWCKSLIDGVEPIYDSIADTPQTDCGKPIECEGCGEHICIGCEHQAKKEAWRKAQTESTGSPIGDYRDGVGAWQTDCGWK